MTKYEIILYCSDEDGHVSRRCRNCPVARPMVPSRQEALANAEAVISEWIETAQELGRPIPQPKGRLLLA